MVGPTETKLPVWQCPIITIIAILAASYLVGLLWQWAFGLLIPSYIAGMIGGVAPLPIWEFIK